jgi:CRP/FNR family cyclic AMP-dependent transcriptional regulator
MAGRVLKVLEEQGLVSASGKTIVVYNTRPKQTISATVTTATS